MSTSKNNDENVTITDEKVMSEMGVQLTPINQSGETTVSYTHLDVYKRQIGSMKKKRKL